MSKMPRKSTPKLPGVQVTGSRKNKPRINPDPVIEVTVKLDKACDWSTLTKNLKSVFGNKVQVIVRDPTSEAEDFADWRKERAELLAKLINLKNQLSNLKPLK